MLTVKVLLDSAFSFANESYKLNSNGSPFLTILVVYKGMSSIGVTAPAYTVVAIFVETLSFSTLVALYFTS